MAHDFSLHSGERQTAPRYSEIRADHRARYEWADARLPENSMGADLFCGIGYGTHLLAKRRLVVGIDGSVAAISQARQHYNSSGTHFRCAVWPGPLYLSGCDFIVSLESLEHVEDGAGFFKAMADALKPVADDVLEKADVRVIGYQSASGRTMTFYGTATIEAKV